LATGGRTRTGISPAGALLDTVAVTVAGGGHPIAAVTRGQSEALRLGAFGHVLDFDDLHLESTAHISVVCVPATLVAGGDEPAYLAGAGVMARLGTALGWRHYAAGWHVTCTAGAMAAAAAAAVAGGLDAARTATAISLAVPASGGVHRAFGTDAKPLQIGFAVEAGVRAAALAAAGATAGVTSLDAWVALVGAPDAAGVVEASLGGPAVPGGLAVKLHPACYALQRPISCLAELRRDGLTAEDVDEIILRTPAATVAPLIHHRPTTGLEGKFSLEYAAAATVLDEHTGFGSFTDDAVRRPAAQALLRRVATQLTGPAGDARRAGPQARRLPGRHRRRPGRRHLGHRARPPPRQAGRDHASRSVGRIRTSLTATWRGHVTT
jgi:2-methylcitrate dehydratase PrpD